MVHSTQRSTLEDSYALAKKTKCKVWPCIVKLWTWQPLSRRCQMLVKIHLQRNKSAKFTDAAILWLKPIQMFKHLNLKIFQAQLVRKERYSLQMVQDCLKILKLLAMQCFKAYEKRRKIILASEESKNSFFTHYSTQILFLKLCLF